MNPSSSTNLMSFLVVSFTSFARTTSYFDSALAFGNRSPINLTKMGLSSVTILGKLKSLRALINKGSSGISGSCLFRPPACLRTDLTALNPHSKFLYLDNISLESMYKETNFLDKALA